MIKKEMLEADLDLSDDVVTSVKTTLFFQKLFKFPDSTQNKGHFSSHSFLVPTLN